MHFTLFTLFALTAAQSLNITTPTPSIPFYSAVNTFTPTATGNTAIPGSVIVITNSAGAGSLTDTFTYTAALSTVAPTGNITRSVTGAAASASNLLPDPKNLQTAAANSLFATSPLSVTLVSSLTVAVIGVLAGGIFMV